MELGAGIRSMEHDGTPVLEAYDRFDVCDGAHGQLLLPWPNRIEHGRYTFDQIEQQLPINDAAGDNAIHGLTRWAPWECTDHRTGQVTLRHRLFPQPGWPGMLDLAVTHRVAPGAMTVSVTARNGGDTRLPFGSGAHPYLVAGPSPIDDWLLEVPAATVCAVDDRGIPTNRQPVASSVHDFRTARSIGSMAIDHPFTDLDRDEQGRATVKLSDPTGRTIALWADHHHRWIQVYTGDHATAPRRRTAIAIEPMTGPPNAFRTGEDLIVLEPGESVSVEWGLTVS